MSDDVCSVFGSSRALLLQCSTFGYLFQTELSQNLQQLSEKARSTTEFIHRLKGMSDKVTVSATSANYDHEYSYRS